MSNTEISVYTILFKIPIKINKKTTNAYAYIENTTNNTIYTMQELHTFL